MPRQRLAPGEHGKITVTHVGEVWFARTYVRLHTGKLREREASSYKSGEDARRTLQRRIKVELESTAPEGMINEKTTLAELFDAWIKAKVVEDGLKQQSVSNYTRVWMGHGRHYIGDLLIGELSTSQADARLKAMPPGQALSLRTVLSGMYGLAVRFDVVDTNPIRETKTAATARKPARALTAAEMDLVRAAVRAFCNPEEGRARAPMLPAFVELLAATGERAGEVLAIRWCDVDLLGDPPTVTVSGTLLDHSKIPGKALHRQDSRKRDAPPHTVLLPKFGVEVLTELFGRTGSAEGPVLTNGSGDWVSATAIMKQLRGSLKGTEVSWVTTHSFRRSVATVVRDGLGIEAAQAQLSHSQMSTTEQRYAQRRTTGPDARAVLDSWAGQGE